MTVLAGALERDGFAVRRRDPSDGRVVLIGVTAAGTDLIRRRRRAGAQAFAQLIEKLPPGETAVLLTALPALRHLREFEEAQRASTLHDPSGGR
jgi:DNA-binding MarR family transcriptional regulator